jgi:hypothetical protein
MGEIAGGEQGHARDVVGRDHTTERCPRCHDVGGVASDIGGHLFARLGDALGGREPRRNGYRPDPVRAEFDGEGLVEPDDAGLGGGVVGRLGPSRRSPAIEVTLMITPVPDMAAAAARAP